jgi:glutathione S-transferase
MSITFYGAPMSTSSFTDLVLEELGVQHERVLLDIAKGDAKKPEFLKLNPNGKVPVLVHDGTVIFESAAITLYLGETFGVEKKLFPAPGPKRGEAMKWIVWTNVSLGEAVRQWSRHSMDWAPADQRNAKAGEASHKDMLDHLRILDDALKGKQFLLGEYSLVDAHVNCFLDWLRMMHVDLGAFPEIVAWGQRCSARPAYARFAERARAGAK